MSKHAFDKWWDAFSGSLRLSPKIDAELLKSIARSAWNQAVLEALGKLDAAVGVVTRRERK